jgi:hypothetical protein
MEDFHQFWCQTDNPLHMKVYATVKDAETKEQGEEFIGS